MMLTDEGIFKSLNVFACTEFTFVVAHFRVYIFTAVLELLKLSLE